MIAARRTPSRGFTLVEMLVVITIIGLMFGAIVLSIGLLGRDHLLADEAQRLQQRLTVARDRAELEARPYGMRLEARSYRFFVWDVRRSIWVASNDEALQTHTLPADIELRLSLDGRRVVLDARPKDSTVTAAPQLGIEADGEFNNFKLRMTRGTDPHAEILRPDADGGLQRESPAADEART